MADKMRVTWFMTDTTTAAVCQTESVRFLTRYPSIVFASAALPKGAGRAAIPRLAGMSVDQLRKNRGQLRPKFDCRSMCPKCYAGTAWFA
jgi:hypothetical protein